MGWSVRVTPYATEAYRDLDGGLQEELREHVAAMAEAPAAHLTVSTRLPGLLEYRYRSALVEGMTMILVFRELDFENERTTLVAITGVMDADEPE